MNIIRHLYKILSHIYKNLICNKKNLSNCLIRYFLIFIGLIIVTIIIWGATGILGLLISLLGFPHLCNKTHLIFSILVGCSSIGLMPTTIIIFAIVIIIIMKWVFKQVINGYKNISYQITKEENGLIINNNNNNDIYDDKDELNEFLLDDKDEENIMYKFTLESDDDN